MTEGSALLLCIAMLVFVPAEHKCKSPASFKLFSHLVWMSSADGRSRRREGCRAHVHHAVLRSGHESACAAACRPRLIRSQPGHARASSGHGHRGQLIQCALLRRRHEGVSAAVLRPGLVRLVRACADARMNLMTMLMQLFYCFPSLSVRRRGLVAVGAMEVCPSCLQVLRS